MSIKIVTDSTSDIGQELAQSLGITVVPIYIRFGDKIYRDGVDLTNEEFYRMLEASPVHPATSQPPPEDFMKIFGEFADKADGIISIHISSKISGTYNSALLASSTINGNCPIEVVDSKFNSGGLALVVMEAARMAKSGFGMNEITEKITETIQHVKMLGMFDTVKYLSFSGRVKKLVLSAASILNIRLLLTFHDGDIARAGMARTFDKGMGKITEFVKNNSGIKELLIVHSMVPEKANQLKEQISGFIDKSKIMILHLGAGLGVHGGPGVLLVAIRQ
ncbi:MAG: DegV family protein [Dehalococcoidales bacterium]|nr:DegV family protein [Dehalococcoidales bacterium]